MPTGTGHRRDAGGGRLRCAGPGIARQYSIAFNQAIDQALQSFAGVPGLEVLRFDAFGLLDEVVRDPAANGFTDIDTACLRGLYIAPTPGAPAPTICSNPDEHLFWDVVHPSAAAHVILADEMYRQVRTAFVPEPRCRRSLLVGALFLGVFVARGDQVRHRRRVGPDRRTPRRVRFPGCCVATTGA